MRTHRHAALGCLVLLATLVSACTPSGSTNPELGLRFERTDAAAPLPGGDDPSGVASSGTDTTIDDPSEGATTEPQLSPDDTGFPQTYTLYTSGSLLEEQFDSGRTFPNDRDGCPRPDDRQERVSCTVVDADGGSFDVTVDGASRGEPANEIRVHAKGGDQSELIVRTILTPSFPSVEVVEGILPDGEAYAAIVVELRDERASVVELWGWPLGEPSPRLLALVPRVVSPRLAPSSEGLGIEHLYYDQDDEALCCPSGVFRGVIARFDGIWQQRGEVRPL